MSREARRRIERLEANLNALTESYYQLFLAVAQDLGYASEGYPPRPAKARTETVMRRATARCEGKP